MNTKLTSICATVILTAAAWLNAAEPTFAPAKPGSAEFEKLKTLVGTWKGKTDMGQGPVDLVVSYRLIAGGSVLEERVFPGTTNEMVTMYYDKEGKVALTHYCVMGNRPEMQLKSSDAKTINFDFDKACGIHPTKESHMHALSIRFDDADTITSSCKAIMDGKPAPEHPTTLKRVKAESASVQ